MILASIGFLDKSGASGANDGPGAQADFRIALDQLAEVFFLIDGDFRFVFVNTAAEIYLGQTEYMLVGQSIGAVLPDFDNSFVAGQFYEALQKRRRIEFETSSVLHADRTIAVRAFPHGDGLGICVRDISDLHRQRQLAAEYNALKTAATAHPLLASGLLNIRGRFEELLPGTAAALGFARQDVSGKRFIDLFPPSARVKSREVLESVLSGKPAKAFTSEILLGGTDTIAVHIALAPRRSTLAIDGAWFLISLPEDRAAA